MSAAAVQLDAVRKDYGHLHALDGLSLQVQPGEVLGLLGHNGAGKTTTIKLILGVIRPSAGSLTVLGRPPWGKGAKTLRMQLGYLPESVSFYEQLSGREVLTYFARLKRVGAAVRDELLERVGLAHAADRRVKTYSKGMRQRLGLAQALLGRPRLLLLDEPTVGLDPLATLDFFTTLGELRRQGTTVILCSHVLPGIEGHIDRAAILGGGRLRAAGTLDELRRRAGLPFVIRARGHWQPGSWDQRFKDQGIAHYKVNGTQLELASAIEAKLDVMRMLLADPAVQDIELQPPTLETLYAHFGAGPGAGEGSCTPS